MSDAELPDSELFEIMMKGKSEIPAFKDKLNDKQREGILGTIPMARLGQGDEIAASVVYLSSSEAAYVTGQTLHVNGGMAMF